MFHIHRFQRLGHAHLWRKVGTIILPTTSWIPVFPLYRLSLVLELSTILEKVKVKVVQSCPTLWDPMDCIVLNSPGQNTGVGSLVLLQQIFLTQELNQGLLHCRWILYQLSYHGSISVSS